MKEPEERSNNNKSNVKENEKKRNGMIEKRERERETETKKKNDRETACLWLRNTLAGKAL